jgi:hypothetical protein
MLSYRDGYYWKAKERRESGEDKREFAEWLKARLGGVRPAEKTMTSVHQLEQNWQVYSVERADPVTLIKPTKVAVQHPFS